MGLPRTGSVTGTVTSQHRCGTRVQLLPLDRLRSMGTRRCAGNAAKPCCTVGAALGSTGTTVGDMVTAHLVPPTHHQLDATSEPSVLLAQQQVIQNLQSLRSSPGSRAAGQTGDTSVLVHRLVPARRGWGTGHLPGSLQVQLLGQRSSVFHQVSFLTQNFSPLFVVVFYEVSLREA